MKTPYDQDPEPDGCVISLWPFFVLLILCLGDPDILDAIIRIINNCCN